MWFSVPWAGVGGKMSGMVQWASELQFWNHSTRCYAIERTNALWYIWIVNQHVKEQSLFSHLIICLSAGIFVGAALFDALPKAEEGLGFIGAIAGILVGLTLWWLQKKTLQRFKQPDLPPLVTSALWLHSALEGIVTALSFGISQSFGWLVLGAMVLHLLPEFFAAVTLMLGSGATKRTSVMVTLGGYGVLFLSFILTYLWLPNFGRALPLLIALSGGAFLYIGLVSFGRRLSFMNSIGFAAGMVITLLIG